MLTTMCPGMILQTCWKMLKFDLAGLIVFFFISAEWQSSTRQSSFFYGTLVNAF